MKPLILTLILFSLSHVVFAISPQDDGEVTGVGIRAHTSEISITDSKVARDLFMRLPVQWKAADLVHGLMFKNDQYIFCVREPERIYHCHVYLKGFGEGELSSFWRDHDYGKGSFVEYVKKKPEKAIAKLAIKNNRLHLYTEGEVAKVLFEKMDLAKTSYHKEGKVPYEKRIGRKMKCVRIEQEDKDYYACRIFVPIGKEKKDELILGPSS